MKVISRPLKDLVLLEPTVFSDERGFFFESYNKASLQKLGIETSFVQDNSSGSKYGTIRGLHFQSGQFAQAKLVSVVAGKILDVALDLRKDSPTFGQYFSVELSSDNRHQLFIPRGFAHGYSVLSENAVVQYKCDNFYSPENESGVLFNDPSLKIDWKIPAEKVIISDKDKKLPLLAKK